MEYAKPYIAPTLTVDLVGFQIIERELCVLLQRRPNEPFEHEWALPGGYVPAGETTMEALNRIIKNKIGLAIEEDFADIAQLRAFDTVARDPRGHAVSVTYVACGYAITLPTLQSETQFVSLSRLPEIAFDHADIITFARGFLAEKLAYTSVARAFLPQEFTLTDLQEVHEAILGLALDKRNFRKKILKDDMLDPTGTMRANVVARPAQLYRFKSGV